MSRKIFFILILLIVNCFLLIVPSVSADGEPWAVSETILLLDQATILKGYTLVVGENDFKLGVRDGAISQSATAVIRQLNETWAPTGPTIDAVGKETNLKRISPAWEFDFLSEKKIGSLNKPLYVAIKNDGTTMNRKVIHFWDGGTKKWKPLPSSADLENNLTRAIIHLPYAILAVFDLPDEYEAYASWYGDNLTPSSLYNGASNKYSIGSYVKVCRLDNLKKCVKIKIVSTGPYVAGRIVDLTKSAFRKIGNPGGGILEVRVIPLE